MSCCNPATNSFPTLDVEGGALTGSLSSAATRTHKREVWSKRNRPAKTLLF